METGRMSDLVIRPATHDDVPLLGQFIRELAAYEKLSHEVVVDDARLREELFGPRTVAEALLGFAGAAPAACAIFFHNFSTFLGRRGIYLEDLFVREAFRRRGYGRAMLTHLAREANRRGCGRFEWSVLDWNAPAIAFYAGMGARVLPEWRTCRLDGDALARFGR
jgi:GNAT superfamily N-acetyltransferase